MPRTLSVPVFALLAVCACAPTSSTEPATSSGAATTEPVVVPEPGAAPTNSNGMISCYYPEIPDAPTLELWLAAERGSAFVAMAVSAGSEDPEPGKTAALEGFAATPAGEWPLGSYVAGAYTVEITHAAAPEFERETWNGRVVSGEHEDLLLCSYYPAEFPSAP